MFRPDRTVPGLSQIKHSFSVHHRIVISATATCAKTHSFAREQPAQLDQSENHEILLNDTVPKRSGNDYGSNFGYL